MTTDGQRRAEVQARKLHDGFAALEAERKRLIDDEADLARRFAALTIEEQNRILARMPATEPPAARLPAFGASLVPKRKPIPGREPR